MCEGSLYDPDLAALAIKQARGDLIEAIFLLRAYRTTLPRLGYAEPVDTGAMAHPPPHLGDLQGPAGRPGAGPDLRLHAPPARSACWQRRLASRRRPTASTRGSTQAGAARDGAARPGGPDRAQRADGDGSADRRHHARSRSPFPPTATSRLQALARGDEGFLLALGYSTQRGYGRTHPFAGEIRMGEVEISFVPEELGFEVPLGRITLTECEMVNQFKGSADAPPQFTRGYGLAFGHSERKAMAMALVDRALRAEELGEEATTPAQDQEFVLAHADNVQATGFVEHLKLPHYVDFQAELALLRQLRARVAGERRSRGSPGEDRAEPPTEPGRPPNDRARRPTTSPTSTSRPSA